MKVLVPTAGVGSPLGETTQFTNKALIKVGKKPVISYIIETYPEDTDFVIPLGHFGDQVKDFLELVYPHRTFEFVSVEPYDGPGSSPSFSMAQAEHLLQEPFIYHACDTIVDFELPKLDHNWVAGYKGAGSSNYASFNVLDGIIQRIHEKGTIHPDFLHIGLIGIRDYDQFWDIKKRLISADKGKNYLNEIHTINEMISSGNEFQVHSVKTWHDTGNVETLLKARQEIIDSFHILDKMGESIFMYDDFVVKFFHDPKTVEHRVARAKVLGSLVPKIQSFSRNFYRYEFSQGDLYADVANPTNFRHFLDWANTNLWKPVREVPKQKFKDVCSDFYHTKSLSRLSNFFETRGIKDSETVINEVAIPPVSQLLELIDFDWLTTSKQTMFHGDFILDNIIKTNDGYTLLDWRQNFGGLIKAGDIYYDFAKLNHNLTVNHGIIHDDLFTVKQHQNHVTCDILRKDTHVQCQTVLFRWLEEHGYDARKVRLLTGLNWLNGASLHHHPFDLLLFYLGKQQVWNALNE